MDDMDPEFLKQFQEQMQELNEILKTHSSTMSEMLKLQQSELENRKKLNSVVEKEQKVVEGNTKLAEAEAKAKESSQKTVDNFNAVLNQSANVFGSLFNAVISGDQSVKKYSATVDAAAGAMKSITAQIPIFGNIVGLMIDAEAKRYKETLSWASTIKDSKDDLVQFAGALPVSSTELAKFSTTAGYSGERMQILSKITGGLGTSLANMGQTAGDGATKFMQMADVGDKVRYKFGLMGVNQDELTKRQAQYMDYLSSSGQVVQTHTKSIADLKKQSLEYAENLTRLTTLTGKNADQLQSDRDRAEAAEQERARTMRENAQLYLLKQQHQEGSEEYKRIEANQRGRKAMLRALTDEYSPEMATDIVNVASQGYITQREAYLGQHGIDYQGALKKAQEMARAGRSDTDIEASTRQGTGEELKESVARRVAGGAGTMLGSSAIDTETANILAGYKIGDKAGTDALNRLLGRGIASEKPGKEAQADAEQRANLVIENAMKAISSMTGSFDVLAKQEQERIQNEIEAQQKLYNSLTDDLKNGGLSLAVEGSKVLADHMTTLTAALDALKGVIILATLGGGISMLLKGRGLAAAGEAGALVAGEGAAVAGGATVAAEGAAVAGGAAAAAKGIKPFLIKDAVTGQLKVLTGAEAAAARSAELAAAETVGTGVTVAGEGAAVAGEGAAVAGGVAGAAKGAGGLLRGAAPWISAAMVGKDAYDWATAEGPAKKEDVYGTVGGGIGALLGGGIGALFGGVGAIPGAAMGAGLGNMIGNWWGASEDEKPQQSNMSSPQTPLITANTDAYNKAVAAFQSSVGLYQTVTDTFGSLITSYGSTVASYGSITNSFMEGVKAYAITSTALIKTLKTAPVLKSLKDAHTGHPNDPEMKTGNKTAFELLTDKLDTLIRITRRDDKEDTEKQTEITTANITAFKQLNTMTDALSKTMKEVDTSFDDLLFILSGHRSGQGAAGAEASTSTSETSSPVGNAAALNAISRAEGTFSTGYNTSLGHGKYLPGGKEQDLTNMSLNQVLELGDYMRKQPGNPNSSALGRYQIVGSTIKDAAKDLNLDLNGSKFDQATQDKIAMWIIKKQGFSAWEGFKNNPEQLDIAKTAMRNSGGLTGSIAASTDAFGNATNALNEFSSKLGTEIPSPGTGRGGIEGLGRYLQSKQLRVDENVYFDGKQPAPGAHSPNGGHYDGTAIDINAPGSVVEATDRKWGPIFDQLATVIGNAGYQVIWREKDHYDHMHVRSPQKAERGGIFKGPKTGYPMEMHGTEMVTPLIQNSALLELAKMPGHILRQDQTGARSSLELTDFRKLRESLDSINEQTTKTVEESTRPFQNVNNQLQSNIRDMVQAQQDTVQVIASKLDELIETMNTSNHHTKKIMKNQH